jgi:hypothetical protein
LSKFANRPSNKALNQHNADRGEPRRFEAGFSFGRENGSARSMLMGHATGKQQQ